MNINLKQNEPFLAPYATIPYMFNGTYYSYIKGISCFASFLLNKQKGEIFEDTICYIIPSEGVYKELSITGSLTIEDRLSKTENFFEKHFGFFKKVQFNDPVQLFVYTSFLDQLATDCFQYIEYRDPKRNDYRNAFRLIDFNALGKNIPENKILTYKNELLELIYHRLPNVYFSLIF
ncbi:hypothetical protein AAGG74_19270 [Bacillus mexicanus]|uniref:hypothetical protein n=1 Tax=Bacillus mexicanus TaxID=2834415 RepID=UPI003D1AFDA3